MERLNKGKCEFIEKIVLILALSMLILVMNMSITHVEAENANSSHIVIESSTSTVLSGDNIHARLPMASTTKIMTALVAIESGKLDDKVIITKDMVGVEGSSIYLKEGEILTLSELLYGLMLRSGNDAAVAIATHVAGSVDDFVSLMNSCANRLNLKDTHFTNPHGLHDDAHYTSAYDLACIASYAMKNDEFRHIVGTKSRIIGGETSNKRYLVNKNKMLNMFDGGNGIKTGYTKRAGRCLVSSSKRGNMELISVVLNEPDMWQYSMNSMDRCYNEYVLLDVARRNSSIAKIEIKGNIYDICTHNDIKYPIKKDNIENLSYKLEYDNIYKHASHGDYLGKLLVYDNKHLIFEEKIYTI